MVAYVQMEFTHVRSIVMISMFAMATVQTVQKCFIFFENIFKHGNMKCQLIKHKNNYF